MSALDILPEDLLRESVEGQGKLLRAMNRMSSAMGTPPAVNIPPAQIMVQPAPVVVRPVKELFGEVLTRDEDGRMKTFRITLTA